MLDGDEKRAEAQLRPFVERGLHLSGRNLSNFLYGSLQLLLGNELAARRTFEALRESAWPRTWTLGSHVASGRLDATPGGAYCSQAFPWELRVLRNHQELLEAVGGTGR